MASIPKIKQGQTFTLNISLSEALSDGVLYVGLFGTSSNYKLILSTEEGGGLTSSGTNTYTATITHAQTKEMALGTYSMEVLIKSGDEDSVVSISDPTQFEIVDSRIGKEVS